MSRLYSSTDYYLIGLGYSGQMIDAQAIKECVRTHRVFSGGDRHQMIVKSFLPKHHTWISIKGNMEDVIRAYDQNDGPIVIFTTGDPYFYGFGNTLKKLRPMAKVKVFPYFNCLQLLSHRAQLNYSEIYPASLHGRPWDKLDEALLSGRKLIGVLTDQKKTPSTTARHLLDYGFKEYRMIIGDELGGDQENVVDLSLEEASGYRCSKLNCLILQRSESPKQIHFGIPDNLFITLAGRPGMITKRAIRVVSISLLELSAANVFWDVGSCSGSIAIEAKRLFPHLSVIAIEKRPECEDIIRVNAKNLKTPGIKVEIGDVFEMGMNTLPKPDTVFIGGHGGKLEELLYLINGFLESCGRIVMNTVKEESEMGFQKICKQMGYSTLSPTSITVDLYNPIKILGATKQ